MPITLFSLAALQNAGRLRGFHMEVAIKISMVTCSISSEAGVPEGNREGERGINNSLYELFSTLCHLNWKKGAGAEPNKECKYAGIYSQTICPFLQQKT